MIFPRLIAIFVLVVLPLVGRAQLSFSSAIDLALRNSPQVMMAEADVERARGGLSEAKDAYVPTLVGGSGLGYSYGFPIGQPSLFNFSSQSLLFNMSQNDYIRSARLSLTAANLSLEEVRQATAEDAAVTFISLDRDIQRTQTLQQQFAYASHLVQIVQDRLDAGQDNEMALTSARLTAAQIKLALLHAEDAEEMDAAHMGRLTGLPPRGLSTLATSVPPLPSLNSSEGTQNERLTPGVEAAYATARSKQHVAFGDARYLYRPQIYFVAQYSLYSTFNNYQIYYNNFQQNNAVIGIQLTLPILDLVHQAKARESAADAIHAQRQADAGRDQLLDGRLKARHATAELIAKAEVATLEQQMAQQQLDVILLQLKSGNGGGGTPLTPKDEMNSRIAEADKRLAMLDTTYDVQQAEINLLRQTGQLENWVKSSALLASPTSPQR